MTVTVVHHIKAAHEGHYVSVWVCGRVFFCCAVMPCGARYVNRERKCIMHDWFCHLISGQFKTLLQVPNVLKKWFINSQEEARRVGHKTERKPRLWSECDGKQLAWAWEHGAWHRVGVVNSASIQMRRLRKQWHFYALNPIQSTEVTWYFYKHGSFIVLVTFENFYDSETDSLTTTTTKKLWSLFNKRQLDKCRTTSI